MKFNSFLALASVVAMNVFTPSALAAAGVKEDVDMSNPSCLVEIKENDSTRFVNVSHIRQLVLDGGLFRDKDKEQKSVYVSMSGNNGFNINYKTKEETIKAMVELKDKINDCQYDVAAKRAERKSPKKN